LNSIRNPVRRRAVLGIAGLALIAGFGFAFINAANFLEAPAQAPVISDAAFVLGGDSGDRTLRAAELHREGMAGIFVVTGMQDVIDEVRSPYLHWRTQVLMLAGVPPEAILVDTASSNSWEEATNGLRLARRHGWKRVLVVSDPPHVRRLSVLWGRAFEGSGIEVRFIAARPRWWVPERWWTSRKSANFVMQEYIKLTYEFF
jgi:uncharacterized SAM-binding protein YcdF (DUF218 family)